MPVTESVGSKLIRLMGWKPGQSLLHSKRKRKALLQTKKEAEEREDKKSSSSSLSYFQYNNKWNIRINQGNL